jgi:hypothetical protein
MKAFTEQPSIWCCHLGPFFALFRKIKNRLRSRVYSHVCSLCCRCIALVEFRVSESKITRFLDDVHIVEALNEPVDDSGLEGDVSEMEYSLSESDSNSGM